MDNTDKAKMSGAFRMIVNIIILILGIVLIAVPNEAMQGITIILGIALLVYAGISIAMFYNLKAKGVDGPSLVLPIIWLVVGILMLVFSNFFANYLLPIVIGIWMIVMGAMSLGGAVTALAKILTVIAIVLGVIIIVAALAGANLVGVLLGICMLIYGIVSLMQWIAVKASAGKA